MSTEGKQLSQLVAVWAQFVAVCIGIGTVLTYMGRKDQQLVTNTEQIRELSSIVSELTKSNINFMLKDQQFDERLIHLTQRLEALERSTD